MKNAFVIRIELFLISILICSFSACDPPGNKNKAAPKKKGVVAIVYADLTNSINEETAATVKRKIGDLFKKLPPETRFYLYSIDEGGSKSDIYSFEPKQLTEIKITTDEKKREKEIEEIKNLKAATEFNKLNDSLNDYHHRISSQRSAVSCLTKKLYPLSDFVKNSCDSIPTPEVKVYFYSDMIEECESSFDSKPLDFKKKPNEIKEKENFQEILNRIEAGFPVDQTRDLKSLGAKIHIILTSQDDKQSYRQLKIIWGKIFGKFGYSAEDIDNKDYFYWGDGTNETLWNLKK